MATTAPAPQLSALEQKLQKSKTSKTAWVGTAVFTVMLVVGLGYIITKLSKDLAAVHSHRCSHTCCLEWRC